MWNSEGKLYNVLQFHLVRKKDAPNPRTHTVYIYLLTYITEIQPQTIWLKIKKVTEPLNAGPGCNCGSHAQPEFKGSVKLNNSTTWGILVNKIIIKLKWHFPKAYYTFIILCVYTCVSLWLCLEWDTGHKILFICIKAEYLFFPGN